MLKSTEAYAPPGVLPSGLSTEVTMSLITKPVGQIAAETPAAIPILEGLGIDYCCGGDQPLDRACAARGLAVEEVVARLEAAASSSPSSPKDWFRAPLGELIDHILEQHHEYLRAELPALENRLTRTLEAHGEKHGEMLRELEQVYRGLQDELYAHLHKEEMILFPAVRLMEQAAAQGRPAPPAPFGSVNNPIRVMRFEHDNAAHALARMREITNNYTLPPDACATWQALYAGLRQLEADLKQHIHLENNILFPRAAALEASGIES